MTDHICNTHPKLPPARWEKSAQQHLKYEIRHWSKHRFFHHIVWRTALKAGKAQFVLNCPPTLLRLWKRAMGGRPASIDTKKTEHKYHCFDGKLNLRCAERCKIRGAQLLFSLLWEALNVLCGGSSQLNYLPLMQCTLFRPQRTKDPSWRWEIIIFGRKTCGRGFCNTRDYYQYRRLSDSLTGLVSKKGSDLGRISWGLNCIYCGTKFLLFTN